MSFIVLIGQVVGDPSTGYQTVWTSDMVEKKTLKLAISHGFRTRESDDFRIGHKRGEWLKAVSWMGKKFFDMDEVADTANEIGLRNYRDDPDDGCGVGWGT